MSTKDARIIAAGQRARNLSEDPTFKEILAGVLERQASVMKDPGVTPETLTEAHAIVRALAKIDEHIRSLDNAAIVEERKQ